MVFVRRNAQVRKIETPQALPRCVWLRPLLFLFFFCFTVPTAHGSTFVIPRDDEMVVSARAIIRGKVLSVASAFDQNKNTVFTYVTLQVKEVIKGRVDARQIVLKEPGGEADGRGSMIFGTPQFISGERVLLYLDTWPDGSLRVHQMFLGKFSIEEDPRTGVTYAIRDAPGSHVEVLAPPGDGAATDRMELSAYIELVRNRLAANRKVAEWFESQHYNGVPILARPPDYDRVSGSGGVQPQFRLLFQARWFEPDDDQPVPVFVNPAGAPSPVIMNDVSGAMGAWSTVPACDLRVSVAGTTSECQPSLNRVQITFNNCDGLWSAGSGAIAFGGLEWDFTRTKVVNGVNFAKAILGRISFNPFAGIGDSCNVREVLTHEMGHVLGLHHSWQPGFEGSPSATAAEATMYYIAHFDGRCASLKADDMNGIRFIYPGTGDPNSITIVTAALPVGVVGAAYSETLTAIGGVSPYNWSLAPASGPIPPGLTLNPGGAISGMPSAGADSVFTIRVSDTAGHFSDKEFSITVLASATPLNAQLLSQSVPTGVEPSQSFNVSFSWKNTGMDAWSAASGIRIGSQNPPNNTNWGGNRVVLPSSTVIAPGQHLLFTFTVFSPSRPGPYDLQFQMLKEGVGFFGEPSTNIRVNVTPGANLTVLGPSSVEGVVGVPFGLQLTVTGGILPYTWSVVSGSLPAGLVLDSGSGLIAGAPTTAGTSSVTIEVADSGSRKGQRQISITIQPPPVEINTLALATGVMGTPYSQQLTARGGVLPYVWSVTAGALPTGLTLDPSTGVIGGTPAVTGEFNPSITARDQSGFGATRSLRLLVVAPEEVPHLTKVKYKPGSGKLVVIGRNFMPTASLRVDDQQVTPKFADSISFVVKQLSLSTGTHTVRVINPNGLPSETLTISVQ